jgi:hypothetical protein
MNKISEVFSIVGAWRQINIRSSIMRATFWFGILVFTSLFGFVACDGWTGDDPTSPTPDPPQLIAVNPTANNSSVNLGNSITATFDKRMNSGSAGTFVVYGYKTGKLTGLYTGGGSQTLRFNPDFAFKTSEILEVILTDSLTATDGTSLATPFIYRFRAEALVGTGVYTAGDTILGQSGARGLATGDWDDDGDSDLAVANFSDSTVVIMKNDGLGTFSTIGGTIIGQSGASAVIALDKDGDGDLDLAVANEGSSTVGILENNGNGNFSSVSVIIGQSNARGLAAGDWDGEIGMAMGTLTWRWRTVPATVLPCWKMTVTAVSQPILRSVPKLVPLPWLPEIGTATETSTWPWQILQHRLFY